jgi:Fe-S-cluster containining protein
MDSEPDGDHRMATVDLTLEGPQWELRGRMTVPTGPSRLDDLLPLARGLSDALVGETIRAVEQSGECISCKAGCGACCRQLVAISEVEARRIGKVVAQLPSPRRAVVEARFAEARRRLGESGLLQDLQDTEKVSDSGYGTLASAYFHQGIACPFLEEESCSIYEERPITCREYLVTSPAENCASPTSENIRRVKMLRPVFNAVARWQVGPSEHFLERWVPLILAPEWAADHPDDAPQRPGLDLLRELLNHMTADDGAPDEDEGRSETSASGVGPDEGSA